MGMYDYIEIGQIKCPLCGKMVNPELQTKAGNCILGVYKLGDVFTLSEGMKTDYNKTQDEKQYSIDITGGCWKCNARITGYMFINTKTMVIEVVRLCEVSRFIEPCVKVESPKSI